jgi:indolepyruvate ferredoxin oxidoreductase alpha subunit
VLPPAPEAGLLLLVAPDPGVGGHSRDRDARDWAARLQLPCLEPGGLQEAYDMSFDAFELSERFLLPVVLRTVPRLAAREGCVRVRSGGPPRTGPGPAGHREELDDDLARAGHSLLIPSMDGSSLAVVTAGMARRDYLECADELSLRPWHLHVGAYPFPAAAIERLVRECDTLLVLEEGYPFLERALRETVAGDLRVLGRETGTLPPGRDLDLAHIRQALDLPEAPRGPGEEDCDADPTE